MDADTALNNVRKILAKPIHRVSVADVSLIKETVNNYFWLKRLDDPKRLEKARLVKTQMEPPTDYKPLCQRCRKPVTEIRWFQPEVEGDFDLEISCHGWTFPSQITKEFVTDCVGSIDQALDFIMSETAVGKT